MLKKFLALIVAGVLALFGGTTLSTPAVAAPPPPVAGKSKAAAVDANEARAARKARDDYIAASGPRAVATRKAADQARVRAAAAARAVPLARARAAAAAQAAAAARARAAALPGTTKVQIKAKKQGEQAAANATRAAARAAAQATASATASARAQARAKAANVAADEAWAIYVALAGPRAELAARNATAARTQADAAARAVAPAQAKAVAAAQRLAVARAQAAAVVKALGSKKTKKAKRAKKRAIAAHKAAWHASVKANTQARAKVDAAAKAAALARDMALAATQAREAAGPNPNWAPTDTVTFNHPRGSRTQKRALITQLNRAIDATPRNGYIRMAMYLFDFGSVTNKLIAAWRRGVHVQVLIDDGMKNKYIKKLKRTLGKNKKARSFVAVCDHSCMSQGTSTIHAKFYLFSVAGQSRYVSLVSSGNPYTGNTTKSWNNTHTITRNRTIYDSLTKYFTDMLPDKTNRNYYRVTKSGKYTVYYYPQKIKKPNDLVWMNVLNRVSCKPTAPGYGNRQQRTLIRVANWGWTQPRISIAKRLWKLHDSGCAVQVMVNRARTSKSVLRVLLKRSKREGQMAVWDAWRDWRKNSVAGLYVHHKFVSINGLLDGRNQKVTLTGSQNFTALGTQANNDIVLRVDDARTTDAYNANFALIRSRWTDRMRKVPAFTRPANRVGGV